MTRAPSCIPLSLPSDAASAIATQLHDERGFIWLDSANSSGQAQGFSLVSCAPSETIAHRPGSASASDFLDNWNQAYLERANQHGSSLPFTGGWLGALYYDFGEELMGIHRNYSEGGATAYVAYHPWAIVFDHQATVLTGLTTVALSMTSHTHSKAPYSIKFRLIPHPKLARLRR